MGPKDRHGYSVAARMHYRADTPHRLHGAQNGPARQHGRGPRVLHVIEAVY